MPNKPLLVLALFISSVSNLVFASNDENEFDYLGFINDTFYLSVGKSDFSGEYAGEYIVTLNGSHNFNDTWRLFGSFDSDAYADIGIGYSFILAEQVYNEVSLTVGGKLENVFTTSGALFTAYKHNDWVFYSNFELQYIDRYKETLDLPIIGLVTIDSHTLALNKLVGFSYDINTVISILSSYGHDKRHINQSKVSGKSEHIAKLKPNHDSYVNLGFALDLWGVKPFLSHRFNLEDSSLNYWDFNLSFDF
ncbi:hypothetical protein [Vibrio maritimus]|uniref:hypothetical protein n=1 Tax=Vibrio maritimus TaxID=990268 RepID=UPI0037360C80